MSELRDAYKKWSGKLYHIMREPTPADIAPLMPAFHPLPLATMTVGDWLDYQKNLWQAVQVREIIRLLMEAKS